MAAEQTQCGVCGAPFAVSPWGVPQQQPDAPAWAQQQQPWSQPPDQQGQPTAQQPGPQQPTPEQPQAWSLPPAPQQPTPTWAQPAPQQPAPQQPAPQQWSQQPGPQPGQQPSGYPQGGPGYPQGGPGYPEGGPGYPQNYPGYQMYAPARSPRTGLIAGIVVVVGIALVIALGGALVLIGASKNSAEVTLTPLVVPTATPAPQGTVVYSPSTIPCGSDYALTITLPATVSGTDVITVKMDGVTAGTETVSPTFTEQADGTWQFFDSTVVDWSCTASGSSSPGRHNEGIYDDLGNLLAYGSYTLV
jgi:hypothetical protein